VPLQSALLDIGGGDDDYQFLGKVDAQACGKNTVGQTVDPAWMGPFYEEACINAILLAAADS
jgi:tRNA G26 N,N-dimethylase Trm1